MTLKADFGYAVNFLKLNGKESIEIDNIKKGSSSNIRSQMFLLTFILDDTKAQVKVPFTLFVIDPPAVVPPTQKIDEEKKPDLASPKNDE